MQMLYWKRGLEIRKCKAVFSMEILSNDEKETRK